MCAFLNQNKKHSSDTKSTAVSTIFAGVSQLELETDRKQPGSRMITGTDNLSRVLDLVVESWLEIQCLHFCAQLSSSPCTSVARTTALHIANRHYGCFRANANDDECIIGRAEDWASIGPGNKFRPLFRKAHSKLNVSQLKPSATFPTLKNTHTTHSIVTT